MGAPLTGVQQRIALPVIPPKRYFSIGEVAELCALKPHVLRYWEQEFIQLRPMKRRGNRRYYQHHEVILVRRIRELLYEEGFTISGARNRLAEAQISARELAAHPPLVALFDEVLAPAVVQGVHGLDLRPADHGSSSVRQIAAPGASVAASEALQAVRVDLLAAMDLLCETVK